MLADADLDEILTLQLAVAWAGEAADEDEKRLGWWRCDLVSKYGGIALFERLAPRTARWAVYELAREAARLVDTDRRKTDATPHVLLSLFHFGFEVDEQLDDRLLALKQAGVPPEQALPRLAALTTWQAEHFAGWLRGTTKPPKTVAEPSGLRLVGEPPASLPVLARACAAVLAALPQRYNCPHYRDAKAS